MNYIYPYTMFNQNYLNTYSQPNYDLQRHHQEQQENIRDLLKAANGLIDAAQKIRPEYQEQAMRELFALILARSMQTQYGGTNSDHTGNCF